MDGFIEDGPPPASQFPPYPISWYFFGRSRDLPRGRPGRLIAADRRLAEYFRWLADAAHGRAPRRDEEDASCPPAVCL